MQITVEGTSGDPNVEKVSIPGYVSKSTPGLIFDTRNQNSFSNYPAMFGPAPLSPAAGAGVSSPPPTRTTMVTVTTTPALAKITARSPDPLADNDPSPTTVSPENSQPTEPENIEPEDSEPEDSEPENDEPGNDEPVLNPAGIVGAITKGATSLGKSSTKKKSGGGGGSVKGPENQGQSSIRKRNPKRTPAPEA